MLSQINFKFSSAQTLHWLPLLKVKVEVFTILQRPYLSFDLMPCTQPLYPHFLSLFPVDSCLATGTSLFLQHASNMPAFELAFIFTWTSLFPYLHGLLPTSFKSCSKCHPLREPCPDNTV